MKTKRIWLVSMLAFVLCAATRLSASDPQESSPAKIRVLVVTGGHAFETNEFFKIFKDNPEITFQAVEHPNAQALLRPEAAKQYDVLVLYDLWQPITDE